MIDDDENDKKLVFISDTICHVMRKIVDDDDHNDDVDYWYSKILSLHMRIWIV